MTSKVLTLGPNDTAGQQQIVFCDTGGDFGPAAANDLRDATSANRLAAQLTLASLPAEGGNGRQSARVDLGSSRVFAYSVQAALEFAATPVANETVDFFWAPLNNTTTTNGPGGVNGVTDAAYSGTAGSTVYESTPQLIWIGSFRVTDDATGTVQVSDIGVFEPPTRYGQLVVVSNATPTLHSDDVESHVVMTPIIQQGQDT